MGETRDDGWADAVPSPDLLSPGAVPRAGEAEVEIEKVVQAVSLASGCGCGLRV